jgi:hypothetical protein
MSALDQGAAMRDIYANLLIALTLMCGTLANGETLASEGTFVIHESDITTWIKDQTAKWFVPNQVIADQIELQSPYHSLLNGFFWSGSANLVWSKDSSTNVWIFDGQATDAKLFARSFEIHDTIVAGVGGSTVAVRVDLVCQNLEIDLPGQWKLHGELPAAWAKSVFNVSLQNMLLQQSGQLPVLHVGACQGPGGAEVFLNQQIAQLFANTAKVRSMISNEFQNLINAQVTKLMAVIKPIQFEILGANVEFNPSAIKNLKSGTWIVDGALTFNGGQSTGTKFVSKTYTDLNVTDARASGLIFSNSLIKEILAFALRAGLYANDFTSNDIASFKSFMENRFLQFFLWSDLINFNSSTVFDFHLSTRGTPVVQSMTNLFPGIQWTLSAPVDVVMSAPEGASELPYVEFFSTQPAQVVLTTQANLAGSLQVNYSVAKMPMWYGYREEFFKVRRPTSTIAIDTVSSQVQSGMTNKSWTYAIPDRASPFPDYKLTFKDLIFGTKTFRLEMGISKK